MFCEMAELARSELKLKLKYSVSCSSPNDPNGQVNLLLDNIRVACDARASIKLQV